MKVPVGAHEVCFTDVPGFSTPPCETVSVIEGATSTVNGAFAPLGLLKVDVNPAGLGVDVIVDGVPRDQFGLYMFIEPGAHEVCGTGRPGWRTSLCQLVNVTANQQVTAVLHYFIPLI